MIDSNQFVNGIWMGTILLVLGLIPGLLLVLGLIPGLLDRMIQGLIEPGAAARFPLPRAMWMRFSADQAAPAPFPHRRWLTAAGMALIVLTVFAYIAH